MEYRRVPADLPPSSCAVAFTICGTTTALRSPVEMMAYMLLCSWLAMANALPAPVVAPTAVTSTMARKNPVSRDTIVPAPMRMLARPIPLTRCPLRPPVAADLRLERGVGLFPGARPAAPDRADDAESQEQHHPADEDDQADRLPLGPHPAPGPMDGTAPT